AVSTIAGTTSEDGAMSTARKRLQLAQEPNVYSVPASDFFRVIQSSVVRSFGALRLPQRGGTSQLAYRLSDRRSHVGSHCDVNSAKPARACAECDRLSCSRLH